MKRRMLALTLAVAMTCSAVGCGAQEGSKDEAAKSTAAEAAKTEGEALQVSENTDEWPVVTVQTLVASEMPDEALIEEELNKYLVSIDAGVKVDMVQLNIGDLSTQLTLMLTDNENPLDLFCWRFYSSLDGCVKNEQCISLDSYKEVYPDLWEMYPESVMKTQQISGVQYAIPAVDSYGTYETYMLREDVAKELGIADRDGEEITKEELTQIMKDAKAIHPEFAYMINTNNEPVIGIDSLGNPDWLGVLLNRGVGTKEIVNLYETEEFREYCMMMREWQEAGLHTDDPLSNNMTIEQYNNGVSAGCFVGGYSADYIKALLTYSPYMSVQYKLTDMVATSASVLGGWMVSTTCKNPDAAMKVLYLMCTDETVARYFILGIENHNYVVDEKGIARYPEGVDSSNMTWNMTCPWFYPNQCLSLPLDTDMETYYTDMLEAPKTAKFSEAMGFVFDSDPVYDQMAACSTIVKEYRDALLYGLVDVDEYLTAFNNELKENGIDEIIAEEQRQLDEFLAAQK